MLLTYYPNMQQGQPRIFSVSLQTFSPRTHTGTFSASHDDAGGGGDGGGDFGPWIKDPL